MLGSPAARRCARVFHQRGVKRRDIALQLLRGDELGRRDDTGAAAIIDRIIATNDGDPKTTARAPANTIGRLTAHP